MREGCSCGAYIQARRGDVLAWRTSHECPDHQGDIDQATGAQVEHAARPEVDGMEARIGFQREAW